MTNSTNATHATHARWGAPLALALCAAPVAGCAGDAGGAGSAGGNPTESTATQSLATSTHEDHEKRPPAESGAEWWQWALSLPFSVNPTLDTTGEDCMLGQHGSVWYLSGILQGGTVTRTCSLPAGVDLFFPIANTTQNNTPGLCGQPADVNLSIRDLIDAARTMIDGVTNMSAEFDGAPIRDVQRIGVHPLFPITQPADNVSVGLGFTPCPAGVFTPNVQDGFYATVHAVKPGTHTLHFHAEFPPNTSPPEDVTYNLTVVRTHDDD